MGPNERARLSWEATTKGPQSACPGLIRSASRQGYAAQAASLALRRWAGFDSFSFWRRRGVKETDGVRRGRSSLVLRQLMLDCTVQAANPFVSIAQLLQPALAGRQGPCLRLRQLLAGDKAANQRVAAE